MLKCVLSVSVSILSLWINVSDEVLAQFVSLIGNQAHFSSALGKKSGRQNSSDRQKTLQKKEVNVF